VSPRGALVLVLVAILMLGGLALWLMNVPWWVVLIIVTAAGSLGRRWVLARFSSNQARQETETRN
jgi:hypothetical protein